jgi:hypothetical protein
MTTWLAVLMVVIGQSGGVQTWDFDQIEVGKLPEGWKVEATGQKAATAKWQVQRDEGAPLGPGVLELTATNHSESGVFNLCWTSAVEFREGDIAVFLRARTGKIDQGGGVIWRVRDRDNYYISRYNPLEQNVGIYYVKDGKRTMLAYSGKLVLADGWHLFKVRHRGDRIQAFLDGDLKLMAHAGDHIPDAGGVGLWTKADAASTFDNFTVIPR